MMRIPFRRSAGIAVLAFASAGSLFADGGQWSGRHWGLGWGDGYHAPPRTGGLPVHVAHAPAPPAAGHFGPRPHLFGTQPSGLMPGGYPYRGERSEEQRSGAPLPQWLWDPKEETVIVDTVEPSSPPADDRVPEPPPSAAAKPTHDPSLGLPPSLSPTEPIDSRAMNRRVRTQARSNGWSR